MVDDGTQTGPESSHMAHLTTTTHPPLSSPGDSLATLEYGACARVLDKLQGRGRPVKHDGPATVTAPSSRESALATVVETPRRRSMHAAPSTQQECSHKYQQSWSAMGDGEPFSWSGDRESRTPPSGATVG